MHSLRVALLFTVVSFATANAQIATEPAPGSTPRGYAIGVVDTTDPSVATAATLAQALQARLPGVSVSMGRGIIGSSARVWLRGPSSIVVNEPLLIIDGVRTHGARPNLSSSDRELPSRLEDIDMETVERVEVLRGPAAAAIYGIAASKGVILVTTKRGQQGPARWTAFAEAGPAMEPTEFPANFGPVSTNGVDGQCPLMDQAARRCTATGLQSFNPLESASPFRTGWSKAAGLTLSGGTSRITYFASGSHDRAEGVYATDRSNATSGRVSLSAAPTTAMDIALTGGYRTDRLLHPAVDWIRSGLFGRAVDDPVGRGYGGGDHERNLRPAREERVERTTLALNATWRHRPWLRTRATLGYDRLLVEEGSTHSTTDWVDAPADTVTYIDRASDRPEARSAAVATAADYMFRGLKARTTLGAEYMREDFSRGDSNGLTRSGVTTPESYSSSTLNLWQGGVAIHLQQHVGWRERLFVTGSLRGDRLTRGAVGSDAIISRSIDVSWMAIEPGGAHASRWLGELRLRGAYGRGGDHVVGASVGGWDGSPPVPSSDMSEQGAELEAGADAVLLRNRVRTSLTYYRAMTRRGLTHRPSSWGDLLGNDAQVRTSGIESAMDATLLEAGGVRWDAGAVISVHDHEVERMGGPEYRIVTGQSFAPGRAIGKYGSSRYSYQDTNGDGLLAVSEAVLLRDDYAWFGAPFPSNEIGVRTALTLGAMQLSAVLDHRGGATLFNETAYIRCRTRCPEQNDPATSIEDQARPVSRMAGTQFAYMEDATYTKLREVQLALVLPSGLTRMTGASRARFTLTGRNLHTWTRYSGLDPEVTSDRYDTTVASDNFYQPTLRSFMARLDLTW